MSQVINNKSTKFLTKRWSYQPNSVSSAPSSTYEHAYTSLGRFQNIPIALGHYSGPGNKVEELDNTIWKTLADFPFADVMYYYSMVTLDGDLFVFGELTIILLLFDNIFKEGLTQRHWHANSMEVSGQKSAHCWMDEEDTDQSLSTTP